MGYRVEVRDRNLNRIGEVDTWIKLDLVIRFCQVGTWQLLIKDGTAQAQLFDKGGGIVVWQDGVIRPVFSGQIESFQKYWTTQQHTAEGSLYIAGKCDNQLAYDRLAFPEPTLPIAQQYKGKDTRAVTGKAGRALWDEFNKGFGPGSLADRRVAGVDLGTAPSIGQDVSASLRYDVIGTTAEDWCANKDIGYRFVYSPDSKKIELDIFTPRDKSKEIRFAKELGNLREFVYTLSAPRTTRVVVACQGEGKERYVFQKIDAQAEAEWGVKREQFVDRRDLALKTDPATGKPVKNSSDMTDAEFETAKKAVVEAADSALKEGEKNGNFQIYPIDTPQCMFGRDYFVGDIVTVATDGTEYVDVVREVNISVEDGGKVTVTPKVGEQGTGEPLNLYKNVWEMREKLRKLEARM
ncbi:siphovirus ReqiPepy6 Gp37-like family protein [Streptomyces sp. NPDC014733]|uniref:siphovirus ReqiPepy6 Gp37-like family protein n=1 Tax=Streptomyces sp. NPDC014733 TaxID=3364885 RepID=UPI0036FE9D35